MSVTPQQLLQLASELHQAAASEVQYRNVIGRAYYSCYHIALDFHGQLSSPGRESPDSAGNHAKLAYRLQNPTIPSTDAKFRISRIVGMRLQAFHAIRVKADYRTDVDISANESRDAIIKAVGIRDVIIGKPSP